MQTVEILLDEEPVATATTDAFGAYEAEVTFESPGIFSLVAVAYRGQPIEVRTARPR